jgi:hypothetical protein
MNGPSTAVTAAPVRTPTNAIAAGDVPAALAAIVIVPSIAGRQDDNPANTAVTIATMLERLGARYDDGAIIVVACRAE